MKNLTPQQIADKWAANTGAATQAYTQGVQGFNGNPMAMAAAASDRYLAGVQNAVSSGKWQASLSGKSADYWKTAAVQKGAPRLASGANQAKPKFVSFMTKFLPVVQSAAAQVRAMPKGGLQNGIARMVQMATLLSQFKNTGA